MRLSDAAVGKIQHAYNGEPLMVTFQHRTDCCHFDVDCGGCLSWCVCCVPYTAYTDDTVTVRGAWFAERDAEPLPTMCSQAGCYCPLPYSLQMTLKNLFMRPPSINPCTELCKICCNGPPLINHVSVDAYEVKIMNELPRLYTTPSASELWHTRTSSVASAGITSPPTSPTVATSNPLISNR